MATWSDKDDNALAIMLDRRAKWLATVEPPLVAALKAIPGKLLEGAAYHPDFVAYFKQRGVADRWILALAPFSKYAIIANVADEATNAPPPPG